jgi:hypothetical protein
MASAHRCGIRNALVWATSFLLTCLSVLSRPIPTERIASFGGIPDFAALAENVTSQYFSNDVLQRYVNGLGEHYPEYVTVFKIGDSVTGIPILAIDISSTAGDLCASSSPFAYKLLSMLCSRSR